MNPTSIQYTPRIIKHWWASTANRFVCHKLIHFDLTRVKSIVVTRKVKRSTQAQNINTTHHL